MNRLDAIIKHLTMMGYEVNTDTWDNRIRVIFISDSGKRVTTALTEAEFNESFVVEKIVREINDEIRKQF